MLDRKELSALYQNHVASLYSYGCKFTADRELVKDCIHDVFVNIHKMEDVANILDIKFYLLKSLKNRLLDEFEKVKTDNIEDEDTFSYTHGVLDENKLMDIDETDRIRKQYIEKIFEHLTKRQKEAVYLYYIEELTYDEICKLLGMNYQSVRNTIHRALVRLREKLGNKPPDFLAIFWFFFDFFRKK